MIEIVIFTDKTSEESHSHTIEKVIEWLESYLNINNYDSSDLADILSLRMVGKNQDEWHCENIILHPEFIFDRVIEDWEWTKGQLLMVSEYVNQLLNLIEDSTHYHVFKFSDEYEKALNRLFYAEIYEIEQMIRSTLTTIFYPKHPDMIYRILELNRATPQGYNAEQVRLHEVGFQNEFFYLDIGNYHNLSNYGLLSKQGLISSSERYTDLSSFIEDVKNYGQLSEDEAGLIASVGENLTVIKDFRNCIMHSRAYGSDDIDSFNKAKDNLTKILLDFQNNDGRDIGSFAIEI